MSTSHSNDARIFIAEEGNNMRFMNSGVARKYIIVSKFCLVQITLIHILRFRDPGLLRGDLSTLPKRIEIIESIYNNLAS